MRTLFFIVILSLPFLNIAQENQPVAPPKIAVKIPLGQSVTLDNTQITFKEVLEDSRCPQYVSCIWAGRIRVLVEVAGPQSTAEEIELLLGATKEGEIENLTILAEETLSITLLQVIPYPGSEAAENGEEYALLVAETKD
jgi:predicted transcriptional regulator